MQIPKYFLNANIFWYCLFSFLKLLPNLRYVSIYHLLVWKRKSPHCFLYCVKKSWIKMIFSTPCLWNCWRKHVLAAAILCTGNTYNLLKEMMETLSISFFSHVSYNSIQKNYLFLVVHLIYTTYRQICFNKVA